MTKYQEALNNANLKGSKSYELLQELVELHTPKKPYDYHDCTKKCPSCRVVLSQDLQQKGHHISKYCEFCGQKLDWSDNNA